MYTVWLSLVKHFSMTELMAAAVLVTWSTSYNSLVGILTILYNGQGWSYERRSAAASLKLLTTLAIV